MLIWYLIALVLSVVLPFINVSLSIFFFAPFLILAIYRLPKHLALYWALAAGLTIDLFSSYTRFGSYACCTVATTFIFYRMRYYLFEESLTTIGLMTYLFSITLTLIQVFFFSITNGSMHLSWEWIKLNMVWYPFITTIYAFFCFTLPAATLLNRKWRLRWLHQRKRRRA